MGNPYILCILYYVLYYVFFPIKKIIFLAILRLLVTSNSLEIKKVRAAESPGKWPAISMGFTGCSIFLVGAQPPPCCSFARHLVGKMAIFFSFAHH